MSPEELRERLERAGLTPYRLSYLLGVEPNEGSKWTRGDRPVPKGRVAQIVELTDFVAEHGAAAVPTPSLSCSPFQAAGANILLLAIERFKSTAVRQGKRHDHENDG